MTTSAAQKFYIDVQQMPYGLGDARIKYAPATSITVNGREGIEGVGPGGYEVYFVDSAGGLVYVNVGPEAGSKVAADELASVGRQVARGVSRPGSTEVAAGFGLGYVPAGLKLTTFSVQTASLVLPMTPGSGPRTSTSHGLGSATAVEPAITVTDTVRPSSSGGMSGRSVQGHATRYTVDQGVTYFTVLDAVDGYAIQISTSRPLGEIYQVADGLVLPQ